MRQGMIGQVDKYKYCGNWWCEKGDMEEQLKQMKIKAINLIRDPKLGASVWTTDMANKADDPKWKTNGISHASTFGWI